MSYYCDLCSNATFNDEQDLLDHIEVIHSVVKEEQNELTEMILIMKEAVSELLLQTYNPRTQNKQNQNTKVLDVDQSYWCEWGKSITSELVSMDKGFFYIQYIHHAREQLELLLQNYVNTYLESKEKIRVYIFGSVTTLNFWDGQSDIDFIATIPSSQAYSLSNKSNSFE